MSDKVAQMAKENTIILVDVGSRGLGLNTPTSDHDHKGVCVESLSQFVTASPFEQWGPKQYAVDELDKWPEGLDLEIYSLRKFMRLALQGNPNILSILFHPKPIYISETGTALQNLAPYVLSRRAVNAFLGYMLAQKSRAAERGRPKYVDQYGFDVKLIMHLLRLGMQGVELMKTGRITLPVPEPNRNYLVQVRQGEIPLEECLKVAEGLEAELKALKDGNNSPLPVEPDWNYCDVWMRSIYWNQWSQTIDRELLLKRKDLGFDKPTIH